MILITGNVGFIGKHLCQYLREHNIDYIGYDLQSGQDIRNKFQLDSFFKDYQVDKVIHLAARAGVRYSTEFPDEYITTNIIGTQNVLECCKKYKVKSLIYFSSSSVYGGDPPCKEDNELKPASIYAITKAAGEKLVEISGVPAVIIRPFTVYGENGRRDQVIYKWINQIKSGQPITFFGEGTTKRGYTYVGDLIQGVLLALNRSLEGVSAYNLGGVEVVDLQRLLSVFKDTFLQVFKIDYQPLPKGDVAESWADISKAKAELGYNPQANFEEKVREIIIKEFNK